MKNKRFTESVENELRGAGWFPLRSVTEDVSNWKLELAKRDDWEIFPEAERVLLEFGGLRINQSGAGQTCAREPFEISPILASGERDRFAMFEKQLDTSLYPLGEIAGGHLFLAIAEDKRVFALMTFLELVGNNMDEAMEKLILGIKGRRM